MRVYYLSFFATMLFTTSSCEDREAQEAMSTTNKEAVRQSISQQFNGEWVFVGMAHPVYQADIFAWAGYVDIRGGEIKATFVRSPQSARTGIYGPGPLFIPEEDQNKASVVYTGRLVSPTEEEMVPEGWLMIEGGCFDEMPLWDGFSGEPDAIYIGSFDPPLMFKRVSAHPIFAPDEEASEVEENPPVDTPLEIDAPFASE